MQKIKKSLVFALVLAPALALAQPKSADDWYKEGETQYNLGNFDKAADAFKQGFSLETVDSKKPAYLYNVAQAYRQGQKCKDAAFFYKRYLSLKDQDTVKPLKPEKRAEIEQRISELEECAKTQETISKKPPDNTISPNGGDTTIPVGGGTKPANGTTTGTTVGQVDGQVDTGEEEGEEGEGDGEGVTETTIEQPRVISARFIGGGAKVNYGELPMPIFASVALQAGYPVLTKDKLQLDAGAVFAFQPIPYRNDALMQDKTGQFISALANVGATYTVAPKIGVRGDLGLGILAFTGISEMGNPFTQNGAATSGALTMFAVRVGVSADYAITPNLVATVMPLAFSFSPAKTGLRDDVSSITRLDFMLGVGYRM